MNNKAALLLGGTGLIGSHLLDYLLQSNCYEKINIIVRRPIEISNSKLNQVIVTDFEGLADESYNFAFNVDDVYCCLGTTIKKAGSQEKFHQVDYLFALKAAQQAKLNGVKQFLIVSSIGADSYSTFFYSRVKGQLEEALIGLGFPALHVFRPSLLLGKRKEFRLGEKLAAVLGKLFAPAFIGSLRKYRPIEGKLVACSLYHNAQEGKSGIHIYQGEQINCNEADNY